MYRIELGSAGRYCDGIHRRSFLQLGVAGMASVGLPALLRARSASAAATGERKKTSVILIWLDGGPSHLDLYDMKPEAPAEYRGLWRPISTNVPGIEISELFPKQAKIADKFSLVRSLHHDTGDHFAGGHRMLTTKDMGVGGNSTPTRFPSIGSIVARQAGPRIAGMPAYVAVPMAASIGLVPGYFGAHMLGVQYDPFQTGGDPNADGFAVPNLNLAPGLSIERLENRRALLSELDKLPRTIDSSPQFRAMAENDREAFEFVAGKAAREAFDISKEDAATRDMYGRHNWGQSTLLARRLVEAGATFVTVHYGGWDHHWDLKAGMENVLPIVDSAVSGLFTDLVRRGLWDTTLVVLCGEFSRTPRMNNGGNGGAPMSMGTPGRDHWGNAMFCLMGGGGVKGGQIVGSTDRLGQAPASRPLRPENVHATIYHVLGIDPKLQLLDRSGRPVNVLDDPTPIGELLQSPSVAAGFLGGQFHMVHRLALFLFVFVFLVSDASAGEFNAVLSVGDVAPAWRDLPGTDGKRHSFSDLDAKKPVVVVFTCNSCPVAVDYEDRIIAFAKRHADAVTLVAINVNRVEADSLPKMQERAKEKSFQHAYLFDESQKIARDYGAHRTPEFFVLSPDRKIVYMGAMDDGSDPANVKIDFLGAAVQSALKGTKLATGETYPRGCRIRFARTRPMK